MGIAIADHWRPGAENFFDRIKNGQILGILGRFDPELPGRYATAKKAELASAAARLCTGDTITKPEVKARPLASVSDTTRFGSADDLNGDALPEQHDAIEQAEIVPHADELACDASAKFEPDMSMKRALLCLWWNG